MEEAEVQLQYSPASLASSAASPDQMDQAVVVLDSCGDLPSSMDPVLLSAALGGATGRGSLVWHNPFPLPTTVRLSLSGPGATSQECLVPGEGSVTITLGFTPKRLHSISAQLTVSACDPRLGKPGTPAEGSPGGAGVPMLLSWRYPIQAIAEVDAAKTSGAAFRFSLVGS
ncbi:flagellar associated protein [Haematococcus lacustris]|uniref:Flagellar associated protein n=1 Tax=Haematococcus lacustris TaxID=44745 RepID=A0A699Z547_HAELA|nr:flagellar associated protein [Haematococcus lacustris]